MNRVVTYVLLFSIILISTKVIGQEIDNELWTGATVKLKIKKKLRIGVRSEYRAKDNMSNQKGIFTEPFISLKPSKYFSTKLLYRYRWKPESYNRQRVSLDCNFTSAQLLKKFDVGYRMRFQNEQEIFTGKQLTNLRNKVEANYNVTKHLVPYCSIENYYRFNSKNEFRKMRYTLGVTIKPIKSLACVLFYRFQHEINVSAPESVNIFGMKLSYGIKI